MKAPMYSPKMAEERKEHHDWVDVLRMASLMMVILGHTVDVYNATPQSDPSASFWGPLFGSLVRPSVPMFAMITGFLLLPYRGDPLAFFRKRIPRVLIPMIIWSVLYYLVPWMTGVLGCDISIVSLFYPFEFHPSQDLGEALRNIVLIPLTFNGYTTHMWYIYMLIGLYLFIPFLSACLEKDMESHGGKLLRIFLVLWGISLLMPFLYEIVQYQILGECAWNRFGTLYYFGGFTGYLVLGWFICQKSSPIRTSYTILKGCLMYGAGFAVTYSGFRILAGMHSYEQEPLLLEMFWQFCSPNVVIMAIGLFSMARLVRVTGTRTKAILKDFSRCSFGCYLMHYIFIGPIAIAYAPIGLPIPILVILIMLSVFLVSWLLAHLLYAILPARASKLILG